jgi:hypothetical protein
MLARLVAARHMNAMPAIVATTPLPRPLRLNQRARLVPSAQFVRWYEIASATPGLGKLELAILAKLAEHHRRLHIDGYAGRLSIERMALDLDVAPPEVRAAVRRLIAACLIGVRPGAGQRASEYLFALPRRVTASLPAAAEELPPF